MKLRRSIWLTGGIERILVCMTFVLALLPTQAVALVSHAPSPVLRSNVLRSKISRFTSLISSAFGGHSALPKRVAGAAGLFYCADKLLMKSERYAQAKKATGSYLRYSHVGRISRDIVVSTLAGAGLQYAFCSAVAHASSSVQEKARLFETRKKWYVGSGIALGCYAYFMLFDSLIHGFPLRPFDLKALKKSLYDTLSTTYDLFLPEDKEQCIDALAEAAEGTLYFGHSNKFVTGVVYWLKKNADRNRTVVTSGIKYRVTGSDMLAAATDFLQDCEYPSDKIDQFRKKFLEIMSKSKGSAVDMQDTSASIGVGVILDELTGVSDKVKNQFKITADEINQVKKGTKASVPEAFLVYGVAGAGKTTLIEAFIRFADVKVVKTKASELFSGDVVKLKKAFNALTVSAHQDQKSIFVFWIEDLKVEHTTKKLLTPDNLDAYLEINKHNTCIKEFQQELATLKRNINNRVLVIAESECVVGPFEKGIEVPSLSLADAAVYLSRSFEKIFGRPDAKLSDSIVKGYDAGLKRYEHLNARKGVKDLALTYSKLDILVKRVTLKASKLAEKSPQNTQPLKDHDILEIADDWVASYTNELGLLRQEPAGSSELDALA